MPTPIAGRFAIVLEAAGACGDMFARNRARIATLVRRSTGLMDLTAALHIGMHIPPQSGDPSLRRATILGTVRGWLLALMALALHHAPSQVRSGPKTPSG